MLTLISSAKTLDFTGPLPTQQHSQPEFIHQADTLVKLCRNLTPTQISSLMSISDKLAKLNANRYAQWQKKADLNNARQAIFAFKGEIYHGLHPEDFTQKDIDFAQQHLRILSGLYGILRPLDLIQPYRLEMSTKLQNKQGKDLYAFWQDDITQSIDAILEKQSHPILIDLAFDDYFKAIIQKQLKAKLVKPIFLDKKNDNYRVINVYAKKARGLMCRYIIKQQVTSIEQLVNFDMDGYKFCRQDSDDEQLIFKRDHH